MRTFAALALAALGGMGCSRSDSGARAHATAQSAAEALGDLGQAAAHGAAAAGNGVACGAREVGQTLSGTQGQPQAEQISARDCNRATQNAHEAGGALDHAQQILNPNAPPPATGGGPSR